MIRPCDIALDGCAGTNSPILNLSAEAPDPLLFTGVGFDPFNPYQPPPLGTLYVSRDCFGVVWSATTQWEADLLALNASAVCSSGGTPVHGIPFTPAPGFPTFPPYDSFGWTPPVLPPPPAYQVFANTPQTATDSCPNGTVFSFTVPAGTLLSAPIDPVLGPAMVELLNAQALAFALAEVWALRVCLDVPNLFLREPLPVIPPPDWPHDVPWPTESTDPHVPPPGWPFGRVWPPPSSRGPMLSSNPGWCCLGSSLDPNLNTYTVTGSGVYYFSISGSVPPGTSLLTTGARSAQLQGIPTTPGQYSYTISAAKQGDPSIAVKITDSLKVFGLQTAALANGTVGAPYTSLLAAAGGTDPVTYSLVGSLPAGLTLAAGGLISGTPSTPGTYLFTVRMTDADNGTCAAPLSLLIVPAPSTKPDWTQLFWTLSDFKHLGTGSVTAIPVNSASDSFNLSAAVPTFPSAGASVADNGALTYNGPACNCNVHVTLSRTGNDIYSFGYIRVYVNFVLVLSADFNPLGAGVYDYPFTLPDTGGVPAAIQFSVSCNAPFVYSNASYATSIRLVGTISNL
jgi:hypothetical protein